MYSFYYDVLKARYKDDVRLIYTDTDRHERTQQHKNNLNKPDPKHIEQQKKTAEEMKRIKHQETIDYLNATFPSYPDG